MFSYACYHNQWSPFFSRLRIEDKDGVPRLHLFVDSGTEYYDTQGCKQETKTQINKYFKCVRLPKKTPIFSKKHKAEIHPDLQLIPKTPIKYPIPIINQTAQQSAYQFNAFEDQSFTIASPEDAKNDICSMTNTGFPGSPTNWEFTQISPQNGYYDDFSFF